MATEADGGQDIAAFVESVLREDRAPSKFNASRAGSAAESISQEPGAAMDRMFATAPGRDAASIVGNESFTLAILSELALEVMVAGAGVPSRAPGSLAAETRLEVLIVHQGPGETPRPFALLLDPVLPKQSRRRVTDDLLFLQPQNIDAAMGALHRISSTEASDHPHREVVRAMMMRGPASLEDLLWIAQPEAVLAAHPEMELVGCPSPALAIQCTRNGIPETSSVGMFCRDSDGVPGVTACHHGTGPAGTAVTLGGLPSTVTLAHQVQDTVFIPLPQGYLIPNHALGLNGVRNTPPPWQGEPCKFDGCTSGQKGTAVSSHSPGLLVIDDLSQNKVQTLPSVNHGDSGSALIDDQDQVVGFAFRRTKFGEPLQFAEWIWAANAMAALGLQPL